MYNENMKIQVHKEMETINPRNLKYSKKRVEALIRYIRDNPLNWCGQYYRPHVILHPALALGYFHIQDDLGFRAWMLEIIITRGLWHP